MKVVVLASALAFSALGTDMQTTKDWFEANDPYRLCWNNSSIGARVFGGNFSTDVASATIYTLRDNLSGAPKTTAAAARMVEDALAHGNRPGMNGIWLQFYSGEGEAGSFSHEPSVGEMTVMLYGSLVKGTRAFWQFMMRPRSTMLYRGTGALYRELDSLRHVLAEGVSLPFESTQEKIVGLSIRWKGALYVVTVNNSYATVEASVRLPVGCERGRAERMFGEGGRDFAGHSIRDVWKPCERHVYRIAPLNGNE